MNEKIYAIGGAGGIGHSWNSLRTVEVYDPTTDTWMKKADMPTPRHSLSTSVVDGKIYAIGGQESVDINTVEMYDPMTDTWTSKASMPTRRRGHAASVVNGKIYVMGGTAGIGKPGMRTLEVYDPALDPPTSVEDNSFGYSMEFRLHQNYPNPFNPSTQIEYKTNM